MPIGRIVSCWAIIFVVAIGATAEEENYKWKSVSGKWRTVNEEGASYLIETKIKAVNWGNSELINYNSIVTSQPGSGVTSLKILLRVSNPAGRSVNMIIFFALENFREFFAFRFAGNEKSLDQVQFINSKIIDKTKPPTEKWNYVISEMDGAKCNLDYNKDYKVEIVFKKEKADLLINGEKLLEGKADMDLGTGKFGFASRNAALRIDDVRAYKDSGIIFEDDFSKDRVQRIIIKGTTEKAKN